MALKVAIVGLPNVGKSTLFNALTKTAAAQAANYPFCTIEPNTGDVAVPEPRLNALAEIAGCFAVWAWMRLGASALWLVPGLASLAAFAWLLTLAPSDAAGRAYAAYGGVYIAASLVWLWAVEGQRPDGWDVTGAAVCLLGAAIILFAPRAA